MLLWSGNRFSVGVLLRKLEFIMYNLSRRKSLPKIGETPDRVGPSTYIVDSYKYCLKNVVPFLNSSLRNYEEPSKKVDTPFYNTDIRYHVKVRSYLILQDLIHLLLTVPQITSCCFKLSNLIVFKTTTQHNTCCASCFVWMMFLNISGWIQYQKQVRTFCGQEIR